MRKVRSLLTLLELNLLKHLQKKQIMLRRLFLRLEMRLKIDFRKQMTVKKKIKIRAKSYNRVKIYKMMDANVDLLC